MAVTLSTPKDEESRAVAIENRGKSVQVFTAFNKIPYNLINEEIDGSAQDTLTELEQICQYYKIYLNGSPFTSEGANGDYIPANMPVKLSAGIIDKEARFLFAEKPTIQIEPKGDVGKITVEAKNMLTNYQDVVNTILNENMFEQALIKAAKDCFIGKRVAIVINFNEEDGVTLTFLPATQFIYETKIGNSSILTKFVAFIIIHDSVNLSNKRIFKKKFELIDGDVYLSEAIYDGAGRVIEMMNDGIKLEIAEIPAVVILNDGLTGDPDGESEIEQLKNYESWYSKLTSADIDGERKGMNPIKYTVDMENNSTKNLSTAAGAYWDLGSDQNLEHPSTQVGMLEPTMSYSSALKTTLDRIKGASYDQVDMPNISLETLTGTITSGKGLKAIYWPLIVRCKEKMKTWGPQLKKMVRLIINGALTYPETITRYSNASLTPVDYEVTVEQNVPLPEDEIDEKTIDLSEVQQQTMSRKYYMQKWRELTDDEVSEELKQMAIERQYLDDAFSMPSYGASGGVMGLSEAFGDDVDTDAAQSSNMASDGATERLSGVQTANLINTILQYANGTLSEGQAARVIATSVGISISEARLILQGTMDDEDTSQSFES